MSEPGAVRSGAGAALAVALLLVVVTFAAGAGDAASPRLRTTGLVGQLLLAVLAVVILAGITLYLATMAGAAERRPTVGRTRRLVTAAAMALALIAAVRFASTYETDQTPAAPAPTEVADEEDPVAEEAEPARGDIDPLIVAAAGLAGFGLLAAAWYRRRRQSSTSEPETLEASVAALLDLTLTELVAGEDPRVGVIRLYRRLELLLEAHGILRTGSQTEVDLMGRALESLSASGDAIRRLTDLFQVAMFSDHAIDQPELTEAIEALSHVTTELRFRR